MKKFWVNLALLIALSFGLENGALAAASQNTQLGPGSVQLPALTTGINNIAIGGVYSTLTTGSNDIIIGPNTLCDVTGATTSNEIDFCGITSTAVFKITGTNVASTSAASFPGTLTVTGATTQTGALTLGGALNPPAGRIGTFVANGASNVTVTNTNITTTSFVIVSLNTVGGTVGNLPHVTTITGATSFTVAGTASDTSTYNYWIVN